MTSAEQDGIIPLADYTRPYKFYGGKTMKKTRIRLTALALCVLLFVTMLPATALASAAVDARTALLSVAR